MTFELSDEEQNGVTIAVNTILKIAYGIEPNEDWSAIANEWWNTSREDDEGAPANLLSENPEAVVIAAVKTLFIEQVKRTQQSLPIGIYVLPTEEDLPPRAVFLVDAGEDTKAVVGGAEWIDGAWRYPDGREVEDELASTITAHAESLGVEWDH